MLDETSDGCDPDAEYEITARPLEESAADGE